MHVVTYVTSMNTIKKGVDNVLLVHRHVQRRRGSEDVVLVDRELCVRPGQPVCMERRRLSRLVRNRNEEKQGSGGAQALWEHRPAYGLWERAICETCGCCGEGEGRRGIPFV